MAAGALCRGLWCRLSLRRGFGYGQAWGFGRCLRGGGLGHGEGGWGLIFLRLWGRGIQAKRVGEQLHRIAPQFQRKARHAIRRIEIPGVIRGTDEIPDGGVKAPSTAQGGAAEFQRHLAVKEGLEITLNRQAFNRRQAGQVEFILGLGGQRLGLRF